MTRSPARGALILGVVAAVLAFCMSLLVQHFGFIGTDSQASAAGRSYFEFRFTSWSPLAESLLFAVQAGLGGAVLGACLGALGRRSQRAQQAQGTGGLS